MNHRVRLGPIAIFLMVVAIILTTLAILTISTTNADKVMAERFAAVTSVRYELEAEGQQFLRDVDEQIAEGAAPERTATFERSGYTLDIEVSAPAADGTCANTNGRRDSAPDTVDDTIESPAIAAAAPPIAPEKPEPALSPTAEKMPSSISTPDDACSP